MDEKSYMDTLIEKLNTPLPRSSVEQRPGPGGRMLSYVNGFTVTDFLNRIFGNLNWDFAIDCVERWVVEDGGKYRATVEVTGTLTIHLPDGTVCKKTDIGYGHGSGFTIGEAMESAGKEARTDCLKRCTKDVGYVLGLALYDPDQKHVK